MAFYLASSGTRGESNGGTLMRKKFGETIVKIAKKDPKVVLLTGDVEQEMEEYK